jgi:hypothetical protein
MFFSVALTCSIYVSETFLSFTYRVCTVNVSETEERMFHFILCILVITFKPLKRTSLIFFIILIKTENTKVKEMSVKHYTYKYKFMSQRMFDFFYTYDLTKRHFIARLYFGRTARWQLFVWQSTRFLHIFPTGFCTTLKVLSPEILFVAISVIVKSRRKCSPFN